MSPHLPYGRTYTVPHKGPGVAVRSQTHKALTSQPAWHSRVPTTVTQSPGAASCSGPPSSHPALTHRPISEQILESAATAACAKAPGPQEARW